MSGTSEKVTPGDDVRQYTSFAADIDLTDATAGSPVARAPRFIRVEDVSAGTTLAILTPGGGATVRTLTVTAGFVLQCMARTIKSTTDVSRITVIW